jgi:glucose-1-phosphate thymidylyltransferase
MKGIILAGGKGTRLAPATHVTNKHLLPILHKPMILYPLETLKTLGIKDILIVSGGNHIGGFAEFLGDGSEYGVSLTYRVQKEAGGIAQALALGKDFARGKGVAVVLGDNVFDNRQFARIQVAPSLNLKENALLFLKQVPDPERFGVPAFNAQGHIVWIEEKPQEPKSPYAVTGLYYYPPDVFDVIPTLQPSARGELEISDVNNYYVARGRCVSVKLPGFWSDAGTPESLYRTSSWAMTQV